MTMDQLAKYEFVGKASHVATAIVGALDLLQTELLQDERFNEQYDNLEPTLDSLHGAIRSLSEVIIQVVNSTNEYTEL